MLETLTSRLSQTAYLYAKSLAIPVTQETMTRHLEENPYYPSLYSLGNVFSKLNIPNQSLRISADQLGLVEAPFIAYMKDENNGKDFVLVTANDESRVQYVTDNNKTKTVSKKKFIQDWENIAFVAERADASGDAEYKKKLAASKKEKQKSNALIAGGITVGVMAAMLLFFTGAENLVAALSILLIKLPGVAVTVLLLIYDIDKTNSFVKNICSATKQTNCDAVLKSKASKIFGMSWAEAGFFYFAATTLFLLFPGIVIATKFTWLAVANAFAVPYILFSIYYQWKVVKQWCPLCLAVQAVLAMELGWSIFSFWKAPLWEPLQAATILAVAIVVILPIVLWFTVKPLLVQQKANKAYKAAYKRLLYNPEIFNGLLNQQRPVAEGYSNLGITIGNPAAANTIIKVCNPYCGPCAKAHPQLEEIIQHNNDVNIKIIFTATNNENDKAGKVVKHLLAIAAKGDIKQTQQALDDWYLATEKDYDSFAAKYPMNGKLKKQGDKIDAMSNWCRQAAIMHTPTIFINGKLLPETYSLDELKHIF